MCVIIYKPAGVELPSDDILDACWAKNPDGGGMMFAKNGGIVVLKGYMNRDIFKTAIHNAYRQNTAMVIHFRIGTNGANNAHNTHPWVVSKHHAICHNGIISWLAGDKNVSDSKLFADVMSAIQPERMYDDLVLKMLDQSIGYNKVVIMDSKGDVRILNEKSGSWIDGCWYSNTHHIVPKFNQQAIFTSDGCYPLSSCFSRESNEPIVDDPVPDDMFIKKVQFNRATGQVEFMTKSNEWFTQPLLEFVEQLDSYDFEPHLRVSIQHKLAQWLMVMPT